MRPIDADVVCSECTSYYAGNCPSDDSVGCAVKDAPTLTLDNLRPKGRWEKTFFTNDRQRVCSICHCTVRQPSYDKGETTLFNYCPKCGADMRGDENG